MYITGKYWGNLIGDTDDSLTLMDYLSEKGKAEVDVREILADFGLDRLEGDFRAPEVPIVYTDEEGWETDIHFAIDLVTDLAALLLECKVSGSVDLGELGGGEASGPLRITPISASWCRRRICGRWPPSAQSCGRSCTAETGRISPRKVDTL